MGQATLIDRVSHMLSGEPARAIGYGAALVIVGVVTVSNALGFTRFSDVNIDIATAFGLATAATTTVVGVVESIRRFVYSPNSVDAIEEEAIDIFGNG